MQSSLHQIWDSSLEYPFYPTIISVSLISLKYPLMFVKDRSAKNIFLIGIPASLATAFGSIYMICAVGVYV
ncbi:hypothetical protein HI914_00294 [Erysiphe necator]|nr:hypothetical protein HI914_00294 [Erysiphe necator]